MRCAVVGHVEWLDFVPVERAGARRDPDHERPLGRAGGRRGRRRGGLLRLGAETTFFTAVGEDELGRRAEEARGRGLRLEVAVRAAPQRRAFTYLDSRASARSPCSGRSCTVRGRPARVGGAGRDRRASLHRRRRRRRSATPAEPASWSRPRGSFDSSLRGCSARRARPQRVIRPSGTSGPARWRRARRLDGGLRRWTVRRGRE